MSNKVETYIWKNQRMSYNDIQGEELMINMTTNRLNECYNHCKSMLYNPSLNNLGRYLILDLLYQQIQYCKAEACKRYFLSMLDKDGKIIYDCDSLIIECRSWMNAVDSDTIKLGDCFHVPIEFSKVPIKTLMMAVQNKLGKFDYSRISLNFLAKLGIYFTQEELSEINNFAEGRTLQEKIEILKWQLDINPVIDIKLTSTGLKESEFRDMIHLRKFKKLEDCTYSKLTTNQLCTLSEKVLPALINKTQHQANVWSEVMSQIEEVAKYKGIVLK